MKINVIVAYSDNFVIGKDNEIPWKYSEDLRYFKKITTNKNNTNKKNIVIMGKNTYLSLQKKPLKDRINIVISSNSNLEKEETKEDLYFCDSLGRTMELCNKLLDENIAENIFIIGGESIYTYFFKSYYYKFLDKVYITRIDKKFEGNKYFYGLEDKFYYTNIIKSIEHPEIEYRTLQYNPDFKNSETVYLNCLKNILRDENEETYTKLKKNILYYDEPLEITIELDLYFPLFSILKEKRNSILQMLIELINTKNISLLINDIILNKNNEINLIDEKPFNSKYNFMIDEINKTIELNVVHEKANMLNELLYNILFCSLVLTFISKLKNFKGNKINYICKKPFILKNETHIVEKIAWNTPDVLPFLEIKNSNQVNIKDFILDDLVFLGLNI